MVIDGQFTINRCSIDHGQIQRVPGNGPSLMWSLTVKPLGLGVVSDDHRDSPSGQKSDQIDHHTYVWMRFDCEMKTDCQ